MKLLVLLLSLLSGPSEFDSFMTSADAFLSKNVRNGNVAYSEIHNNPAEIGQLYEQIGNMDLSGLDEEEKKAFYINAYNLVVIYQVSKYYPLKSPLDASGFFDAVKHKVAGESITLNVLEYKKLLIPYQDARVHFTLACAAKSCPLLASFAYDASKLDTQLDERTRKAINDKKWLMVNASSQTASISKIFDWYKKDFIRDGGSILGYINKYRDEKIPSAFAVDFYEYNWQLNE